MTVRDDPVAAPPTWPEDLDDLERGLLSAVLQLPPTARALDPDAALAPGSSLTVTGLDGLFDAQLASRHLDHAARWLRSMGEGFYTIGSAGHEANALVAAALRPTDPALLHYRSGGFYLARAQQCDHDGVTDVLLGLLASSDEPIAGGRHKVFGHAGLAIVPQTSTIASHLPRAMGVAFAIGRAARLGLPTRWPADAIAVASFGDASLNHSTAQGALNAAAYVAHQGLAMPLLLVCEDNGWGISVPTPPGWVEAALSGRPGLRYERAEGTDPIGVHDAAEELADDVRAAARPAVLHLRTVRYGGHAGTDVEAAYRSAAGIRADAALDPLLATARALVAAGRTTPAAIVQRYLSGRAEVRERATELRARPRLRTAGEVLAPLAPHRPALVAELAAGAAAPQRRAAFFGRLPEDEGRLTLAESINRTLGDLLCADERVLVFGEDVGAKGGVYGVTRGLQRKAGRRRVFDTLLDEQSILGVALGAGLSGLVPIPEIQYLAYLHNAEDQLRGEAASLAFFSNGQFTNPLVVRIAGYGYQRGFGGHFHNDNGVAVLRDVPGLVIASPAHPSDAPAMLRTCVAAAVTDGTVCVFLEPIARYHTRDLHQPGDEGWTAPYAPPAAWAHEHVPIGAPAVVREGDGDDVLVVTWANGRFLAERAAQRLAGEGIACRILDLRWLAPMPVADVARHAAAVGRVLVVDETRRTGGVGEAVVAGLAEAGYAGPLRRLAAVDSFVPLGDAAELVLVSEDDVVAAVRQLVGSR
jgi:2-oxoisovalerate dehydrogenase E1 component